MVETFLGLMIPIIFLTAAFGIVTIALINRARRNTLEHKERMLAIEKGTDIPSMTWMPTQQKNPYLWGFIFIAFGLTMLINMFIEGDSDWGWGGLFLFLGIAILTANILYKHDLEKQNSEMRNRDVETSSMANTGAV